MKTHFNLYFLVTTLLLQGCLPDKDQPKPADVLPPYTQQGANTIGCLVDGRVLVPGFSMADKYFGWSAVDNDFTFYFDRDEERVYVGIWDSSITDTGEYELTNMLDINTMKQRKVLYQNKIIGGGESVGGKLHIKYWNKKKHIMAGTFYFDAVAADSSVVKITNGRFDMIYN